MANAFLCTSLLFVIVVSVSLSPLSVYSARWENRTELFKICGGDDGCLPGEFCDLSDYDLYLSNQTGICTSCTDCPGLYKRFARYHCERSYLECGECLEGYDEVLGPIWDPICKEMRDLVPEPQPTLKTPAQENPGGRFSISHAVMSFIMWLGIVMILLLILKALISAGQRLIAVISRKSRAENKKPLGHSFQEIHHKISEDDEERLRSEDI